MRCYPGALLDYQKAFTDGLFHEGIMLGTLRPRLQVVEDTSAVKFVSDIIQCTASRKVTLENS